MERDDGFRVEYFLEHSDYSATPRDVYYAVDEMVETVKWRVGTPHRSAQPASRGDQP